MNAWTTATPGDATRAVRAMRTVAADIAAAEQAVLVQAIRAYVRAGVTDSRAIALGLGVKRRDIERARMRAPQWVEGTPGLVSAVIETVWGRTSAGR